MLICARAMQQQAVTNAKDQFEKFAEQETGWTGIRDQIMKQRDQSTQLLVGKTDSSIAAKAAKLVVQMEATKQAYASAEENLNNAIKSFEDAAKAAEELSCMMRTATSTLQDAALKAARTAARGLQSERLQTVAGQRDVVLARLQTAQAQALAEQKFLIDDFVRR